MPDSAVWEAGEVNKSWAGLVMCGWQAKASEQKKEGAQMIDSLN